jgi:hypothetical protein
MTAVAAFVTLAALLVSCADGEAGGDADGAIRIDWDLRRGHSVADVGWGDPDLSARSLDDVAAVTLRLPAGLTFSAGDEVARVFTDRRGGQVGLVDVVSEPRPVDEATELARTWARRLKLPSAPLDRWAATGGRGRGLANRYPARLGGADGPGLQVSLERSGDGAIVTASFIWDR